jgi:hypothetical protein
VKIKNISQTGSQSMPEIAERKFMNITKRLGGKLAIVLGLALLGSQSGCGLPGMRGGPPGLPGLPGLPGPPRVELSKPPGKSAGVIAGEHLGDNGAPLLVQNEK